MDLKNSRIFQKLVLVFVLLNFLVCPYVFIGMMFAPQMIGFLTPVVCPDGMEMEIETEERLDNEGDMATFATMHCVDSREKIDISWKAFLIMIGFPLLGVAVFFIAPTSRAKREDRIVIDPEGME